MLLLSDVTKMLLTPRPRLGQFLAGGGIGRSISSRLVKHERKVALKVLKPELAAVVGAERFLAEIKTTPNLTHPHILPLFDSGEAEGHGKKINNGKCLPLFLIMAPAVRSPATPGIRRLSPVFHNPCALGIPFATYRRREVVSGGPEGVAGEPFKFRR